VILGKFLSRFDLWQRRNRKFLGDDQGCLSEQTVCIPPLARHAMCFKTHECTGALLYNILVRMPVHKHVTFVVFNFLIAWDLPMDLPADPGIRIRKEESETTIQMSCF
jgi:hypothetical protein